MLWSGLQEIDVVHCSPLFGWKVAVKLGSLFVYATSDSSKVNDFLILFIYLTKHMLQFPKIVELIFYTEHFESYFILNLEHFFWETL